MKKREQQPAITTAPIQIKEKLLALDGSLMGVLLLIKKNPAQGGGFLVAAEYDKIPEELGWPNRVPRTYALVWPGTSGAHAHDYGTEREIMHALIGKARVYLWNKSGESVQVELTTKNVEPGYMQALYIPCGIFHTVRYSKRAILLVHTTEDYDRGYYKVLNPAGDAFSQNGQPTEYFTKEGLKKFFETFKQIPARP